MIRNIEIKDAKAFLEMKCKLDRQTKNMMYEIDERPRDLTQVEDEIRNLEKEDSLILVAEEAGEIVGFLSADRGQYKRIKHTAYIVIGILEDYRGRGIGTTLFQALEKWRKEKKITRLELTVMCHNTSGIALYKKNGFEVEGIKKHSMYVDGEYIDEYYMAKIIAE